MSEVNFRYHHLMRLPDGEPCGGCAARKGTEASQTPLTMEDFRDAVATGRPFYCHEAVTGWPHAYGNVTRLCRGWINAINDKDRPLEAS